MRKTSLILMYNFKGFPVQSNQAKLIKCKERDVYLSSAVYRLQIELLDQTQCTFSWSVICIAFATVPTPSITCAHAHKKSQSYTTDSNTEYPNQLFFDILNAKISLHRIIYSARCPIKIGMMTFMIRFN